MLLKGTKQRKMFHYNVHKEKACAVYQPRPYGHSWCAPPEESDRIKFGWRKRRASLLPPAHFSRLFYHRRPPTHTHTKTHTHTHTHIHVLCGQRVPPALSLLRGEKEASDSGTLSYCAFPPLSPLLLPSLPPSLLHTLTHSDPQSY